MEKMVNFIDIPEEKAEELSTEVFCGIGVFGPRNHQKQCEKFLFSELAEREINEIIEV